MEKERARLEIRLQQARRMETVGTFSSGIAHNFNNILAGSLAIPRWRAGLAVTRVWGSYQGAPWNPNGSSQLIVEAVPT